MLKGIYTALITPFKENKKINYEKFIELIEEQINKGVDGLVILGTTGEASSLTNKEKNDLVDLAILVINKRVKLIVGCSSSNTLEASKFALKLSKKKIDYLLVLTPYYLKTNNEGVIKHFNEIANKSKVPIIMYHVPSRTGQYIDKCVIKELSKHKNIIGIKEASGDLSYIDSIKEYLNDDFILLSGNDELLIETLKKGGSGIISVLSNVYPEVSIKTYNLCLNNKYKEASEYYQKYIDFIKLLFIEPNPIPIKEVMNYLNKEVGDYRLPLTNMSNINKSILINELEEINK